MGVKKGGLDKSKIGAYTAWDRPEREDPMPRLKSALFAVLAAGLPLLASAITPPAPAPDPRAAAAQLFADPLERETFISMMSRNPDLTAAVVAAEASAQQTGGADAGAVAAAIQKDPGAPAWSQGVVDALKDARTAIAAGMRLPAPQTEYPDKPLIGDLIKSLHKQNAADLYVGINVALRKREPAAAPPGPATAAACPTGTAPAKALDAANAAAASGDMSAVTGDCQPAAPGVVPGAPAKPPVKIDPAITTPAGPKPVTDQRTTTGPPPSPGQDKDGSDSSGSSLPWSKIGMGASLGAGIGMIMGFGTPLGLIGGALIGAVVGVALFSGVLGKLFGGGKSNS